MDLTDDEAAFVEEAERRIREQSEKRRAAGHYDKIHAVVRSTSGALYEGMPLETSMKQFDHCAERHAINELLYAETESAAVDAILVAGPVPDADAPVTTPCGGCRHVIDDFGDDPTVFCTNFVREEEDLTMFPTMERYDIPELYPANYEQPTWE